MTITRTPAVPTRAHLEKFFSRVDPMRGRLIFAVDATASRQPTWDLAAQLQAQMFATVDALGGLHVQLVYYRGLGECVASRWLSDGKALGSIMSRVNCAAGHTQIQRVLTHARRENARAQVNALILISDACEEIPGDLFADARELVGVPVFFFQEGDNVEVARVYAEIADITGGAYCKLDAGSAQRLANLLRAVAAFAVGGVKALTGQNTEAARLLLAQIKK